MSRDPDQWQKLVSCTQACPVRTDACGYVTAIADGNFERAYAIARRNNPFVSICGRVCGAPCETACRRGQIDAPVAIRSLKRFVTERFGVEAGRNGVRPVPRTHEERIAIIGAGVAGLAAAHDLARLGYGVTVLEAREKPGGMLTYGVPLFRLNRDVVVQEIQAILGLGVSYQSGKAWGRDFSLADLRRDGFKAILLAVGLWSGRKLDIPGVDESGVYDAIAFLEAYNRGNPLPVGKRVIVIGGGNVAMDVARCARRMNEAEVTIVCIEARSEMRAAAIEVEEALHEDIGLCTNRSPLAIHRSGNHLRLRTARCLSLTTNGQFQPVLDDSDIQDFDADTVIFAVGQAANLLSLVASEGIAVARGIISVDPSTGQTSVPDVFAAGDISHGARLLIDAIAAGQVAARGIHQRFGAIDATRPAVHWRRSAFRMSRGLQEMRHEPPGLPTELRIGSNAPVEMGYREREAIDQASRCLRCNINTAFDTSICVACRACERICPNNLIQLRPESPGALHFVGAIPPLDDEPLPLMMLKDESTCIRCGLCADACPTEAITMQELLS